MYSEIEWVTLGDRGAQGVTGAYGGAQGLCTVADRGSQGVQELCTRDDREIEGRERQGIIIRTWGFQS